jgi:hypothetical protein
MLVATGQTHNCGFTSDQVLDCGDHVHGSCRNRWVECATCPERSWSASGARRNWRQLGAIAAHARIDGKRLRGIEKCSLVHVEIGVERGHILEIANLAALVVQGRNRPSCAPSSTPMTWAV